MTHQELIILLKQTGLPVAYGEFKKATEPPFITFMRVNNMNQSADNIAYIAVKNYNIELYANKKEPDTESLLEDILTQNEIFWNVENEAFIPDEQMYQVVYSIQI